MMECNYDEVEIIIREDDEDVTLDGQICPVCGKYKFHRDNCFEYCKVCGWQDDGVQRDDPDEEYGANPCSLNEFKKKYEELIKKNK